MNVITEEIIYKCLKDCIEPQTEWIYGCTYDDATDGMAAFMSLAELEGARKLTDKLVEYLNQAELNQSVK